MGFFQGAAPPGRPSLVSRLVNVTYNAVSKVPRILTLCPLLTCVQRECQLYFPDAFPQPPVPTADKVNELYQGWNIQSDNLFFANGIRTPLLTLFIP